MKEEEEVEEEKDGQESAEGERMAQMAVGGNEGLWRGDGAHEELMGWGLIARCASLIPIHSHSIHTRPPYSSPGIQRHFPTGKVKALISGHFVAILCLL